MGLKKKEPKNKRINKDVTEYNCLGLLEYQEGRPLCHGPPQTLKMKNCKAKPSSFSKSKAGFSRVFGVRPGFRSICKRFFWFSKSFRFDRYENAYF